MITTYAQFGPSTANWGDDLLTSIAGDCYIPAFEGPPWYEVGEWNVEGVVLDIKTQMRLNGAVGFFAIENHIVVGCIWGYPVGKNGLDKIPCAGMYLDEICVAPSHHGKGIGSQLYQLWKSAVGSQTILARTMTNPPTVVYQWFLKLGYKVVAEYNDQKRRVILIKDL